MPDHSRQTSDGCRTATFARRVLVPIDFSETSRAALAWAVGFVSECDASLHVLHVLEEIVGAEPLQWHLGARSEIERAIERGAWDDLRHLLSAHDQARLRVQLAVEWGSPTLEILRYATAHHVDLIAMGRYGRSGVRNLLLGSVAEKVVRSASCAVLSIRHPVIDRTGHQRHRRPVVAEP